MMALLASLAWSVVAAYGLWLHDRLRTRELEASERSTRARGTSERESKLERAKLKADTRLEIARLSLPASVAHPRTAKDIALPDDLEAHVMQWSDEWARDDERLNIRAKYLEFHSGDADATWQKVRRAVGIGELP